MHFPIRLDQYIGKMQKLSKTECPRVVVGPFSFITNSCIYQIHVHQIKVPEKMLMLAWILHGKIRKKLVHWTIIFSNWLLMTWFHFLVLEVFFGGVQATKKTKSPRKMGLMLFNIFFGFLGACFQPEIVHENSVFTIISIYIVLFSKVKTKFSWSNTLEFRAENVLQKSEKKSWRT